jgi:predicted dehydrogenase
MTDTTDVQPVDFADLTETELPKPDAEPDDSALIVTELPEGTLSVTDFAKYMTRKKIEQGEDDFFVLPQTVYQRVNRKSDPLPHVILRETKEAKDTDGTVKLEESDRVYVLVNEAEAVWDNVRVRGERTGPSRTSEDVADRLLRAGKARVRLAAIQKRFARVSDQLAKQETLVGKYDSLLGEDNKTWEDATNAYDEWEASNETDKDIEDES